MKKQMIGILFLGFAAIWMGIIFLLSHQNGVTSGGLSDQLGLDFIYIFMRRYYENCTPEQQQALLYSVASFFRKAAHFLEYGILACFLYVGFSGFFKIKYCNALSFAICFLYAVSDEYHQSFVAGRSPQLKDVMIDSLGALSVLLGIAIINQLLYFMRIGRRKYVD